MSVRRFLAAVFGSLIITAAGPAAALDSALLAGIKARNIGPAGMSGRISAIAAVAADPGTIVIGAAYVLKF